MSDSHKAALAEGRAQGRAVRRYLEALDAHKPKRGRKRTPESMQKRLDRIEADLPSADPLKRLQLVQERIDLTSQLGAAGETVDLTELEAEFVTAAKGYSERKGISYQAWRELGVSAATLKSRASAAARPDSPARPNWSPKRRENDVLGDQLEKDQAAELTALAVASSDCSNGTPSTLPSSSV